MGRPFGGSTRTHSAPATTQKKPPKTSASLIVATRYSVALLRGLEMCRRAGPELVQQGCLVGAGRLESLQLDMPEAADFLRDCRNADRKMMIGRCQSVQHFGKRFLVIHNERALHAPLRRIAEDVEGRATQALEPCQRPEAEHHPRSK